MPRQRRTNDDALNASFSANFDPDSAPPLPTEVETGESLSVAVVARAAPAAAVAPVPAPPAAVVPRRDRREDELQNLAGLRNSRCKGPDKTYTAEWKSFRVWVHSQRVLRNEEEIVPGTAYLTRDNVDDYFIYVVPHMKKCNDSVKRIVSALEYFAMWDENERRNNFQVRPSSMCFVSRGIALHKVLVDQRAEPDPGMAPSALPKLYDHLPTNVVTAADTIKAMTYVLTFRDDWMSVCPIWNNSFSTYIRNMSARGLFFQDLFLDRAHGPEPDGPLSRSVNNVLCPGLAHKDRYKKAKVVGTWRHRNYLQCCTGMTAFSVTWRLFNEYGSHLHFLKPTLRTGEKHDWFWRHRFIHEELSSDYKASYNAFTKIFKDCDISSAKLTHLRKSGIDYAGFAGLSNDVISSMSKHVTHKFQKCYQPELREDVQRVMAGFGKNETWYVPRATIKLPMPIEELQLILFPHIQRYRHEVESREGDKEGRNFVFELLPFFAEVVVQDGIYWVKDFPRHPMSQLLIQNIPNYLPWAETKRAEVVALTNSFDDEQIKRLNLACQAALNSLKGTMTNLGDKINANLEAFHSTQRTSGQAITTGFAEINQHLHDVSIVPAASSTTNTVVLCARCSRPTTSVNYGVRRDSTTATRISNVERSQNSATNRLAIAPPPPPPPPRVVHRGVDTGGTHMSVIDQLESAPPLPVYGDSGSRIPDTFVSILYEYYKHQHSRFEGENVDKKHWGMPLKLSFGRRQKCMGLIRSRAAGNTRNRGNEEQDRLRAAAKILDNEKKAGKHTMTVYMANHWKRQIGSGVIKGRSKKMRPAEEDGGETVVRDRVRVLSHGQRTLAAAQASIAPPTAAQIAQAAKDKDDLHEFLHD